MIKLGEKIKKLRKEKNISQEVLANYLGVTFQAISKWETGAAMPDVTLIPAIASFFDVSTDELFDFNVYTIEKNVNAITREYSKYWDIDKAKSEQILRDGLKRYPGNDILLKCLIDVIPIPERAAEVIELCQTLIAGTHYDDIKYDTYRSMAETYKSIGEYALAKDAIEHIPEIYFTKLGVAAKLLEDEDMFHPANQQKLISFEDLINMYDFLADYYIKRGENDKAQIQLETALKIIHAVKADFATKYTRNPYEAFSERLGGFEEKLRSIRD